MSGHDGNNRPKGRCCAGIYCAHPTMELSQAHKCFACRKILHIMCGEFVEGTDSDYICNECVHTKKVNDATLPFPSMQIAAGDGNNRPKGRCCAGIHCAFPTMELSQAHKCFACGLILHIMCGEFVEGTDSDYICNGCVNKKIAAKPTSTLTPLARTGQTAALSPAAVMAAGFSPELTAAVAALFTGNSENAIDHATTEPLPAALLVAGTGADQLDDPPLEREAPNTTSSQKRQRRLSSDGKPTSRKRKAVLKTGTRIGLGSRVKTTRSKLYHVLQTDAQRDCLPSTQANSHNFFGIVVGGTSQKGYDVQFDALPMDENIVQAYTRTKLTVVAKDEEEKDYDRPPQFDSVSTTTAAKKSPFIESAEHFCSLPIPELKAAKIYVMKYDNNPQEHIIWEILADKEYVSEVENDPTTKPHTADIPKLSHEDMETSELNKTFFKHFFPETNGHAAIIDEYLSSNHASHHETYVTDCIKFHDEADADPDWKVRQCYTLIIAAATEIENGVSNLWKRGPSGGRHDFPDFGRYMPVNYFKCFASAAPFCWADRKNWYTDKRDMPWEVFLPCLSSFNERRKNLVTTVLMMLDESMSGWRPKTSKLGGLPNYTFEPRKPIPLGTMFKNGVECITGVLVFQDIVQMKEQQVRKPYFDMDTHLPDQSKIGAHTAEVLRQVEGAQLVNGGWVGGDSWFGSVATAVELQRIKGVHSTWIVKQNNQFYPMRAMHALLKARYKDHPAGHWVVMRSVIGGVKLFAMAYAWSQSGVSYFLSTCGKTSPSAIMYKTHFEDDFGNVRTRQINRPEIAHFLFQYLPLIDEHNKQRQNILNLEKSWPTQNCWFRLLVTVTGMCVVDLHRVYRNIKLSDGSATEKEAEEVDTMAIRVFSDKLCNNLRVMTGRAAENVARFNFRAHHVNAAGGGQNEDGALLVRIKDDNGFATRAVTTKQASKGRSVGTSRQQNCFICRKYLGADGKTVFNNTSLCCAMCYMPLCKQERGRQMTCLQEHKLSKCDILGCGETHVKGRPFPKLQQVPFPTQDEPL